MKLQNILFPILATCAITCAGVFCVSSFSHAEDKYSSLLLQNIEALTQDNDVNDKYETKRTDKMTMHDDETNSHKKIVVIICEGTGDLDCP